MAVETVVEMLDSRTGNVDYKFHRTYTRKFKVYCNSDNDDAVVAATNAYIPDLYSSYPNDLRCRVKNVDATCDGPYTSTVTGQGRIWTVTLTYDSIFEFDPTQWVENPLLRPALWKYSWETVERFVPYDKDFVALKNSAGTPINPPLAQKYAIPIITININKSVWTVGNYADVQDCVNSDTWFGAEPGTVLVRGVTAEQKWENNVLYWAVQWTLALNETYPWNPTKVLDQGFYYKEGGQLKLARDFQGSPLPHPILLGADGNKTETPHWLEFNMRDEITFAGLIP